MSPSASDGPIVLVDDSESERVLTRMYYELASLPHPWLEFASGESFVAYLETLHVGSEVAPVAVLVDINMPMLSGFEVVSKARALPRHAQLPLFLFSSSDDPRDARRSMEAGATGFIRKPTGPDEYARLFMRLQRQIGDASDSV